MSAETQYRAVQQPSANLKSVHLGTECQSILIHSILNAEMAFRLIYFDICVWVLGSFLIR